MEGSSPGSSHGGGGGQGPGAPAEAEAEAEAGAGGHRDLTARFRRAWEAGTSSGSVPARVPPPEITALEAAAAELAARGTGCRRALDQLADVTGRLVRERANARRLHAARHGRDAASNAAGVLEAVTTVVVPAPGQQVGQAVQGRLQGLAGKVLHPVNQVLTPVGGLLQKTYSGTLGKLAGGGGPQRKGTRSDEVALTDGSMRALEATRNVLQKEVVEHLKALRRLVGAVPALGARGSSERQLKANLHMAAKDWVLTFAGEVKASARALEGEAGAGALDPGLLAATTAAQITEFYALFYHVTQQSLFLPQLVNWRERLAPGIREARGNLARVLEKALQQEHEAQCRAAKLKKPKKLSKKVVKGKLQAVETEPRREVFAVEPGKPRKAVAEAILAELQGGVEQAVGRVELAGSAIREDCSAQVRLVRASDAAIHPFRGELQRLADLR